MQIQPIKNVSNFKQDVQYKKYSKENSLDVINLIKQKLVPADDYVKDRIKRLTKMIYELKKAFCALLFGATCYVVCGLRG